MWCFTKIKKITTRIRKNCYFLSSDFGFGFITQSVTQFAEARIIFSVSILPSTSTRFDFINNLWNKFHQDPNAVLENNIILLFNYGNEIYNSEGGIDFLH